MGQEIEKAEFNDADFKQFQRCLDEEMDLLRELFKNHVFESKHEVAGYELEAWLVDQSTQPVPINHEFIAKLSNPLVVHELSRFNVELNSEPHELSGGVLSLMQAELSELWKKCDEAAESLDSRLAMIGTLPVLDDSQLTTENMSEVDRYRALNEQVLKLRQGKPIKLDISGRDHLQSSHLDVMLEAAATSFQIHLQVRPENAVRCYNASVLTSAPLLAAAANSPILFGRDLWDETRIPLFEQAVNTDSGGVIGHTGHSRVTFGHAWCKDSVLELFEENIELYPVLLPTVSDVDKEELWHLRMHNGTIWRWNRPLIGVDDGGHHLRIEQRVVPAGPTIVDMIANAAFYFGLTTVLAKEQTAPESLIDFDQVKNDFYLVAEQGLEAEINWPGERRQNVRDLLLEKLIPAAEQGLAELSISRQDINYYLGVFQARVESGMNGASWQRAYIGHHDCSMQEMTEAYIQNQQSYKPVHEWLI
ncbi:MAG: glutamate--cysteine ligase [Gammaproteobacteria bacterium]|nr:glutamate--cysteine ligase [Gammaproteobacteria bacterium]